MAKELKNLYWVEDFLPKGSIKKPMFGGFGYYLEQKLILVLFEGEGQRSYKNKKFDFEIWNGCMFPVEPALQAGVKSQLDFLINHPVLPKWLYLPLETDDFEAKVEMTMRQLRRRDSSFGTVPKEKNQRVVLQKLKLIKVFRVKRLT